MIDLVAFPYHDWRKGEHESVRTRDGHLLRELGRHPAIGTLVVVDRPVSLAERLATRRGVAVTGHRLARRRLGPGWEGTLTQVAPRIVVLDVATPGVLGPGRDSRGWWFDVFEDRHVHMALDWALEQAAVSAPAAIAWTPAIVGAIEHLNPSRFAFDSLDNWVSHPILRRHGDRARAAYERMLPSADVVFVPADATRRELEPYAPHAVVLPNGVDLERFANPRPRPGDLPQGPIVGYVGKLGVRLDIPLIRATAAAVPDVTFVFIGPALEPDFVRPLTGMANVVLLGDRRMEDVPAYLAKFDVAWIPHRVGEGETGGDLMKKYEYWAAGRQVVSTSIADLDAWARQLHIVHSASEAAGLIRGLLDGSIAPTTTEVPPERTWPAVAGVVVGALMGLAHDDQASPSADA